MHRRGARSCRHLPLLLSQLVLGLDLCGQGLLLSSVHLSLQGGVRLKVHPGGCLSLRPGSARTWRGAIVALRLRSLSAGR